MEKIENINVEEIKIDYSNGNAIFLRKLFLKIKIFLMIIYFFNMMIQNYVGD